jgi:hypothetical protein
LFSSLAIPILNITLTPPEPVIINLDNSDEIEEYRTDISSLKIQLDELDTQLIKTA